MITWENIWWVVIPAALFAGYFLLIPLLILATQRMCADGEILPFDPVKTPPPPSLATYFHGTDAALSDLGFRRLGSFALPDTAPNLRAILQLYLNDERRDLAMVSVVHGTVEQGPDLQTRYVEFVSRFSGGSTRIVQTNNCREVGSFAPLPQELTFRFPHVRDLVHLYQLHEALVWRHADGGRKIVRVLEQFGEDARAYLREVVLRESYQDQEATGYLRFNEAGNCWRPTVKGAYLMTWKELWPIKQLLRARIRRNAYQLERDLS
jgi:hypothetical protein